MKYSTGRIGRVVRGRETRYLPFQMNPSDFKDMAGVEWAETMSPGSPAPFYQYVTGKPRKLTVEIFLDAFESQRYKVSLQQWIDFLDEFLPSEQFQIPPKMLFAFGPFVFEGDLEEIDRNFTMFNSKLEPIRATARMTIRYAPSKITPSYSGQGSMAQLFME